MEATGWNFLPSQLLNEDDLLLSNLLVVANKVLELKK
jgi:hypothetical protein